MKTERESIVTASTRNTSRSRKSGSLRHRGKICVGRELEIRLAGLCNGKDAGLRKREKAKIILWFSTGGSW